MKIVADMSLYPLKNEPVPDIIEFIRALRDRPGLDVVSNQLSTQVSGPFEAVTAAGLTFIGPSARAIRAMGLKDAAKALMAKAGVPVVPGYHGSEQDPGYLAGEADQIGYPVLIKAAAGGGGRGR